MLYSLKEFKGLSYAKCEYFSHCLLWNVPTVSLILLETAEKTISMNASLHLL